MKFCFETRGRFYLSLREKNECRQVASPCRCWKEGNVEERERKSDHDACKWHREEGVRGQLHQKSEKAQSIRESKQDSREGRKNQNMKKRNLFVPK